MLYSYSSEDRILVDIIISLFLFACWVGLAWALRETVLTLPDWKRSELVWCSLLLLLVSVLLLFSLSNVFVIEVRLFHGGEPVVPGLSE